MVALVIVERDEVREDAYNDHGRYPDDDVACQHQGREPNTVVPCKGHCGRDFEGFRVPSYWIRSKRLRRLVERPSGILLRMVGG